MKKRNLFAIFITLILFLVSCSYKTEYDQCTQNVETMKGINTGLTSQLNQKTTDYNNLKKSYDDLQIKFDALTNVYNSTASNLNNCQTDLAKVLQENKALVTKVTTSKVASWILVAEMFFAGIAWYFIGRGLDQHRMKSFLIWFIAIVSLTIAVMVILIYGVG